MTRPERPLGRDGKSSSAPGRFTLYFTRTGWVHALLLLSAWLFLFPFFWMLATSIKTDDELLEPKLLPEIVSFHPTSPYVRSEIDLQPPGDVDAARWQQISPRLSKIASAAIAKYQQSHAPEPSMESFDADGHRSAATVALVNAAVARLNRRLWSGDDKPLLDEFRKQIDDSAVAQALADALARIELLSFQIRTLDLHTYHFTEGADFASTWRVESGDAKLFKTGDTTRLSYHFDSSASPPVVLRYDFDLPAGVDPKTLYKLSLSAIADNSWHQVNCTFDIAGRRWQSDECTYLAQYRPMSLLFQPPTFDDTSMRAKVWTTIADVGPSPESAVSAPISFDKPTPAILRVTISPSSAVRANWGKD